MKNDDEKNLEINAETEEKNNDKVDIEEVEALDKDDTVNKSMIVDSDELFRMQKKLNKSFTKNVILSIFCIICVVVFLLEGVLVYLIYQKNEGFFNIISNATKVESEESTASPSTPKKALDLDSFMQKLSYVEYLVNHAFYYRRGNNSFDVFYYEKDSKKVEDGMFAGYVAALGDRYAQYFPKQEYTEFVQAASGEYYGIGAVCTQNFNTMEATVTDVYEDSPAEKRPEGLSVEFIP
ncbi:MAG: hypothetical protein MJ151_02645, partial [Lachnospiraceae bacterium]|nr:hypothetical protein [Lachnospiraceae bacterium]